jgi:hypothetical protein
VLTLQDFLNFYRVEVLNMWQVEMLNIYEVKMLNISNELFRILKVHGYRYRQRKSNPL